MYFHTTTLRRKLVEHVSYKANNQNFKAKFVNGCLESITVDGKDVCFNNQSHVYSKIVSFYNAVENFREVASDDKKTLSSTVEERVASIIANH